MEVYDSSDVHDTLNSIYENLAYTIEYFQQRGSGWVLDKLLALELHLLEFDPLRATSYISLPAHIRNKKAVINIRNNDEKCFMVCYCWFTFQTCRATSSGKTISLLGVREGIQPSRYFISNGFKGYSKVRKGE